MKHFIMNKKNIEFTLINSTFVKELFEQGITEYQVQKKDRNRPSFVWLKTVNNTCIKIYSIINELEHWDEVGSLCFEVVDEFPSDISWIKLNYSWRKINELSKMILIEDNLRVECGLKIINEDLDSIILLPSTFPNSIEIKSEFYSGGFDPECGIEDYFFEKY